MPEGTVAVANRGARENMSIEEDVTNDVWDNLTAACRSCNSSKGKKSLLAWMAQA